jgi:hypothetical protein
MTAILVIGLGAEGGDLELVAALDDDDHTELAAHRDRALEEPLDLLRHGRGDEVVIPGHAAQQQVPDTPPHPKCRKAPLLQTPDQPPGGLGERASLAASPPKELALPLPQAG